MNNQFSNCPICLNQGRKIEEYVQESSIFERQPIFKCTNCSYHWNNNITQSDLNEYYKSDYNLLNFNREKRFVSPLKYFQNEKYQFKPNRSKQHLKIARKLINNKDNLDVLDCGAGMGTTLFWAKSFFNKPSLFAYENDKFAHNYLRHIGAKVLSGDPIESLKSSDKSYDLIILSHFLEHISTLSLIEYVGLLQRKLKDKGVLLIEVPHDDWSKYNHLVRNNPPHVSFFSLQSLKKLFNSKFHIHFCVSVGSSIRQKRSIIRKVFERIFHIIYYKFFKIPRTIDGDSIIICVTSKNRILKSSQ